VESPARAVALAVGVILLGCGVGYLATVLFIFPPRDLAADLERVPDVVGETVEEARERVESAGLVFATGSGFHHEAEKGRVIAQEPLAGQMARPGATVTVTASLGPRMGTVPDIVGLSQDQAEGILQGAGYEGELVWVDDEADPGQVVGTRPAPGTPVELPGKVTLLVSAGPPRVQVPELTLRPLSSVRETLERLGLRLGQVTEVPAEGTPGVVLEQDPAAGTEVARGTEIVVTVVSSTGAASPDSASPAGGRRGGRRLGIP
jgi:serine/threonine-protein kinase